MTDKEKLYNWICWKTETEGGNFLFSKAKSDEPTYFQNINEQPALEEYYIDTRVDIERYMDNYFDEDLTGIRTECIKAILKGIHKCSTGVINNKETRNKKTTGIREYIYNF